MHRYVTLVGTALAQVSSRPGITWKFIVLDTDAVNAFAAPGGFVHITKGALANLKTEFELAGVLGHEIIHVSEKHTIRAIQKNKSIQMGADAIDIGKTIHPHPTLGEASMISAQHSIGIAVDIMNK